VHKQFLLLCRARQPGFGRHIEGAGILPQSLGRRRNIRRRTPVSAYPQQSGHALGMKKQKVKKTGYCVNIFEKSDEKVKKTAKRVKKKRYAFLRNHAIFALKF